MKLLRHLLLAVLILGSLALGQVLNTTWQFTVNEGNMPSYITTDNDDVRGIAAFGNKVYLGSFRSKGIKILDKATGDSIGTVTESAISLGDVNTDNDGIIFGSKMVGHTGQWLPVGPVVIYMWNADDAVRDTLLSWIPDTSAATGSPYFRLGDKFSVEGSYADGTLQVYLVDSGWWGKNIYKFKMTDGTMDQIPEIITLSGENFVKTDNQAHVAPLPDTDDFLLSGSGQKITYIGADGSFGEQFSTGFAGDGNALAAFEANNRKFVVQNLIWSAQSFQVLEWTDGIANAFRHWDMTPAAFGPSGNNGNMIGDVACINNGDGTVDIYAMMTDCGIGAYRLEVPITPVEPMNMTSAWEIDGGEKEWFKSSGDQVRGMGYNSALDLIMIASRVDNVIHLLDAETGDEVGALDMTGVDGGFYGIKLMKVVADENGVIYACNLASNGDFKIYRWADTSAVPTVALQQNVATRFGDMLAIYGSGTDTKLYASERDGTQIKVFGTADGETFAEVMSIPIAAGAANGGISIVDDTMFWINAAWKNPVKIDTAGTVLATATGIDDYYGNVLYMEGMHGQKLLAVSANHSEGNRRKIKVYNITEDETAPSFWASGETGNYERANGNVAGDLQYKVNENGTIQLFQMTTNNSIASWNLDVPIYDNDITITFDNDSDITNWGAHDEANAWTSFTYDTDKKALKMNDAGWGFLGKRPIAASIGTNFRLSMSVMVSAWGHETNRLLATVEGLDATPDTIAIEPTSYFQHFNINGTADLAATGYIKFFGMNNGTPSEVYVDYILFDDYAQDVLLVVEDNAFDYGETAFHGNKVMTTVAKNNGSENMIFDSFRFADGSYFSATASKDVVTPGDSAVISIAFNPDIADSITDKLTIVTNGGIANIALSGSGYELWPVDWRIAAGDENTEWFWSMANQHYVRGIAYNHLNNHLYVVSRIGGPNIFILDAATGDMIGKLDNTGIAQNDATYHVNLVDVTEDGQIIVTSLGRTPNLFNVYHWTDEKAVPTKAFGEDVKMVAGDAMSVAGTGTNLTIYSAGHWSTNSNDNELNKMLKLTTTDLVTWEQTLLDLPAPRDANYGISTVGNGEYVFINGTGPNPPMYMKADGTILHTFDSGVYPSGTSVEYFEVQGEVVARRFVAITNGWSSGVSVIELLGEPGDSLCSAMELMGPATEDYATVSNANATAMSVYNPYNNSIIELVTNNGITSYSLEVIAPEAVTPNMALASVSPRTVNFGTLLGGSKTLTFQISNPGTQDLEIEGAVSADAAVTTNLTATTIAAGSSAEFELTVDPMTLAGEVEIPVKIHTNIGLEFVTAAANCIAVMGDPIDESFAGWSAFEGNGWTGYGATLHNMDGYGHGDAKFIGGKDSDVETTILTPKLVDPTKLVFYYAEWSGSDSWELQVMLADDTTGGEIHWIDTLGTLTPPGNFDWVLANYDLTDAGDVFIGFQISGTITGTFCLDDVKIDAKGYWVEGTAIDENFASWSSYDGSGWSGTNVVLRTDGYGHGDDNYIGPSDGGLNSPMTIISPKLVEPTHVAFYYGIYNLSDSWTARVMLSTDGGQSWCDTLGTLTAPESFDWAYADFTIQPDQDYYVGIMVDGTVSGGMFIDDFKADAKGTTVGIDEENVPVTFSLSQNYPNPFNPTTNIQLVLPKATNVKLMVYNLAGQKVAALRNEYMKAGYHTINFDASMLASGIYFYRVEAGEFTDVKKMTLLK
ncbi:MAG: DUF4623 domain-containing protein [Candidatus Marinimicrobia bacterium]|nr:DUF4623 domain-containing protein [Candidatus Neomarinimicrobiota bacterium]